MRVLWLLNAPLPEALSVLTGRPEVSHSTGSWVCALTEALGQRSDITLFTAAPSPLTRKLVEVKGPSATHFVVPVKGNHWKELSERVRPDVVHIHGTEFPFFLDYVETCGSDHVVASLQGLLCAYREVIYGGIPEETIRRYITFRDILRKDSLVDKRADMWRRGDAEIALLKKLKHVMGRTFWDQEVSLNVNPDLQYHYCGEALREPFYTGKWEFERCIPHRIFLSQGTNPFKGVHLLFAALPEVLRKYPDTSVHIAGPNVLIGGRVKVKFFKNGFGNYLSALIRQYGLQETVRFIGESDAERIKRELLAANLFLLPSVIENSPNSLCEAQLLGVPSVASDVGGTSALIPDASCGTLYPFDDVQALSAAILRAFEESSSFDNTRMRAVAAERHNRARIVRDLLQVYGEVSD